MAALYDRPVSSIHQIWPSECILMSAEGNDNPPLPNTNRRRISIAVKYHNRIKFASDVIVWSDTIVTAMIQEESIGFLLFLY